MHRASARRSVQRPGGGIVRFLFVLALAGGAFATSCSKQSPGGFVRPPMPVETAAVLQGPVVDRFEVVGSIEAGEAIEVVAEIDAVVKSLPFREGASVRQGDLLAQLDDSTLRAEVSRAEAVLEQSRVTYERVKSVVEQKAGAPQDLDDALADLKVAEANLALARARLEKSRIVAPFSGLVGARRVSPGAFLRAGAPITDLAQIDWIKVSFWVPERSLPGLQRGTPVRVSTTAYPGYELAGEIDVVEPVLDASLRSARIVARATNPEGKFRPGMSANVTAILSERPSALSIPSEAVFVEGQQSFVYVVKPDSTVMRAAVTLGTRTPETVEVVAGLEPGMRVVRAGHQKLFDGAKTLPIAADAAPAAPPAAANGPEPAATASRADGEEKR